MSSDAFSIEAEAAVAMAGAATTTMTIEMETEMSTLTQLIDQLAQQVGVDTNAMLGSLAQLQNYQGDLSTLPTTHKATLVGAIAEIANGLNSIDLTAVIDDSLADGSKTWSSIKIQAAINAGLASLVDGADGALDTIKELAEALQNQPDIISALQNALAKRVAVDHEQNFTAAERAQGLANIGAAAAADLQALSGTVSTFMADVGDIANANFLGTYNAAKAGA